MNIRVDLNYPINDGVEVVFRSPVDCSQVTGLKVYYPENGATTSKEFVLADAHGNNVGDIDHLFVENVVVKVILDVTTGMAFVQNADTNAYLEGRFSHIEEMATNPDMHAEYFTITDSGVISLKPEYRGACPSNRVSTYPFAVSDNGANVAGSKNAELPKSLVIPEIVGEIAVVSLANGMFLWNHAVASITLPNIVTAIPERFCDNAWYFKNLNNTERITSVGIYAFQKAQIRKANFPNLISLGKNAFVYCPYLLYADIGKVTQIDNYTFFMCTRLSRVEGCSEVTSIGNCAFAKTYRLYNIDSLAKVKTIGQDAFTRSRLDYDWQSLANNGCTFGVHATPLQLQTEDDDDNNDATSPFANVFWKDESLKTFTVCENPVPTLLSQLDKRWYNDPINSSITYTNGCAWMVIMHIYCALHNLALTDVAEFEDICNSIDPNIMGKYNQTSAVSKEIFEDLGLTAELVTLDYSTAVETLQKIRTAVANGGYVYALLAAAVGGSPFVQHAAMVYGVNANGELLYADSSDQAAFEMTDGRSVVKYPMPFQNSVDISDDRVKHYQFIIVTK